MCFAEVAQGLAGESFQAGKVSCHGSGMRRCFSGFAVTADGFHRADVTRP
jgi:hypothetical protein